MTIADSGNMVPFSARAIEEHDVARVVLQGEFDLAGLGQARAALDQALKIDAPRVTIDLTGLTFIDSSGLRFVMEAHATCTEQGRELRIRPGRPDVQRVFSLTGLDGVLPFDREA